MLMQELYPDFAQLPKVTSTVLRKRPKTKKKERKKSKKVRGENNLEN